MSDAAANLLHRILSILEEGLPGWAVASLVAGLCVVAALAALAYARTARTTITVTVDNSKVDTGEMPVRAPERLTRPRANAGRSYAELNRIARLEGDEDEELWIS